MSSAAVLEVIGAGAGATAKQDWHSLWKESDEFQTVQRQIDQYHEKFAGQESAADKSPDSGRSYAAHTTTQFALVTKRVFQHYWRDPTYVMAKVMLNVRPLLHLRFLSASADFPRRSSPVSSSDFRSGTRPTTSLASRTNSSPSSWL